MKPWTQGRASKNITYFFPAAEIHIYKLGIIHKTGHEKFIYPNVSIIINLRS